MLSGCSSESMSEVGQTRHIHDVYATSASPSRATTMARRGKRRFFAVDDARPILAPYRSVDVADETVLYPGTPRGQLDLLISARLKVWKRRKRIYEAARARFASAGHNSSTVSCPLLDMQRCCMMPCFARRHRNSVVVYRSGKRWWRNFLHRELTFGSCSRLRSLCLTC